MGHQAIRILWWYRSASADFYQDQLVAQPHAKSEGGAAGTEARHEDAASALAKGRDIVGHGRRISVHHLYTDGTCDGLSSVVCRGEAILIVIVGLNNGLGLAHGVGSAAEARRPAPGLPRRAAEALPEALAPPEGLGQVEARQLLRRRHSRRRRGRGIRPSRVGRRSSRCRGRPHAAGRGRAASSLPPGARQAHRPGTPRQRQHLAARRRLGPGAAAEDERRAVVPLSRRPRDPATSAVEPQ
mmetsp:Transcript_171169/g.548673  ORF Transcript_171169/g.548673 Transcript_171169/m.548673 type:complete len:242 (-) Transcript_171169:95-820(-)